MITYEILLSHLKSMSPDKLQQTVTVYLSDIDESFGIEKTFYTIEGDKLDGVLDLDHFVLKV